MGVTKNRQSESTVRHMARAAFGEKQVKIVMELTEGMCNAAYLVQFVDGSKSVLKIAPKCSDGLMTNEVNMMDAEVKAMRIVKEKGIVKVAEVQYYDTTKSICSGNYFFMEALKGQSFASIKDGLTEEEKSAIHYETGQIARKLTGIQGDHFGLLGDTEHQYAELSDFVYDLIVNVLSDAAKKNIVIGVSSDEILAKLAEDRWVFKSVKQPVLVHWDMWDGNIFVENGHISGIIDWERALWGEAFMDDRFRKHTRNTDFLKGFGKEMFTGEELLRIYWYDVFLYLTMMTEGAYRGYADDSQYKWAKILFETSWGEMKNVRSQIL